MPPTKSHFITFPGPDDCPMMLSRSTREFHRTHIEMVKGSVPKYQAALSGTDTWSLLPSRPIPPPAFPDVQLGPLVSVPVLPLPDPSPAELPLPSSKFPPPIRDVSP